MTETPQADVAAIRVKPSRVGFTLAAIIYAAFLTGLLIMSLTQKPYVHADHTPPPAAEPTDSQGS